MKPGIPFLRKTRPRTERLTLLDELRGVTLISMILYHFLWDLVYIADISIPWYHSLGAYIWQQSICRTFIFLSGFCWPLGRHPFRRGATVFLAGGAVSAVTLLFVPQDRVLFGVLTLTGSCMILMIPLDKLLGRIRSLPVLGILWGLSLFLFHALFISLPPLPESIPRGYLLAYLGYPAGDFYSTDYFPLLPWFFLFAAGYLFCRLAEKPGLLKRPWLFRSLCPAAAAAGRHSLLIYMLHQPILYGITLLISCNHVF